MGTKGHLVIVRTGGSIINLDSYNCQELGLAKALTHKGWKVSIILAGHAPEVRRIAVADKEVEIHFVRFRKINQALSWFEHIEALLDSLKPDKIQIHEFGMLMSYRVLRWGMIHHIPVYLIQGSYQTTRKPLFKQLEQLFNASFGRYIIKHVSGVGCKSLMAEKYVQSVYQRTCSPAFIGLDTEKFQHRMDEDWRNKLGISKDKKVMLYVGILEPRRNPLFLLQIMASLPDDYVLLMVGAGPQAEQSKEVVQSLHLDKRVYLLGKLKQEQLPAIYEASDLFLLASDYEIYGMVLLEAMYFGLPVVSTYNAGAEVLIEDEKDGFVLHNKDVNAWTETIRSACANPDQLSEMKQRASHKIAQQLVWDIASCQFESIYLQ